MVIDYVIPDNYPLGSNEPYPDLLEMVSYGQIRPILYPRDITSGKAVHEIPSSI